MLHIMEENVKMSQLVPQEQIQGRIVEGVTDVLVSQVMVEAAGVANSFRSQRST